MACHATCFQIEYQAQGKTVLSAAVAPDNRKCNNEAGKTAAENAAKDQLDKEMDRKKEDVNNCTQEAGCACPPWPAWPAGGWKVTQAGLTSVQSVTIGECKWTIVLQYDRAERSRSAKCKAA